METTPSTFHYYWQEVRKHPWLLTQVLIGTIGMQVAALVTPLYMRQFANVIARGVVDQVTVSHLGIVTLLIAISLFAGWVMRRMQIRGLIYLEEGVKTSLSKQAFAYLIEHSHNFFVDQFAGTLTRRVSRYAESFEALFDAIIMNFIPTTLFVGGAIIILSAQYWLLGLALGIWTAISLWAQVIFSRRILPLRRAVVEADSRKTGALADAIGNHPSISFFAGSNHERSHFGEMVDVAHKSSMNLWLTNDSNWGITGFLSTGINAVLIYAAFVLWTHGQFDAGDFVLLQLYVMGVVDRLWDINRTLRRWDSAVTGAQEMVDILNTPHEIQDVSNAPALTILHGGIAFNNVVFTFNEGTPVFEHLNLNIRGGEKVALVGISGAGKSTITKLLLRLYDVKSGSITIDGQNIAEVTQDSLRNAIAFVPQEPILFHRSLMENIRYGRRDATDEEVVEAAKQAHCHEFISALPRGYTTLVGERGVKLSGGERQRVAIARAILKDAPILVLDEATSSLDSESEAFIQDALAKLMEGKTVVAIAHRLSTIMKMDRIVVLENGKIVDQGTHDQLLNNHGLYQKLWNIQAGGFMAVEV